jgi:hypothetical protein
VIKTKVRSDKKENPFYCPEHFYAEKQPRRRRATRPYSGEDITV